MRWMIGLGLAGCQAGEVDWETAEAGEIGDEVEEDWAGATMVVTEPAAGSWLEWTSSSAFSAVITDASGQPVDFEEIIWRSDVDPDWTLTGSSVEDDTLEPGTHVITATATVPGGHQLTYAVGGVRVQSVYAGTYVGDIVVDAVYDAYQASCIGAAVLVVDDRGEAAVGSADCLISLMGFEMDLAYDLDLENDDGAIGGDANADIWGYAVPMDFGGTMSRDGELSGDFGGEVFGGFSVTGELETIRVSRDTQ